MTVNKDQAKDMSQEMMTADDQEAKKKAEQNGEPNQLPHKPATVTSDPTLPGGGSSSGGKQLPSIPDADTQLALANRMKDMRVSSAGSKTAQNYGQFFVEYSLMAEYNLLLRKKLPGVYVVPSYKSPLVWFGVLFVRQGLYQEGVFKFTLHIPESYPDSDCPRLVFDQCVFHPVVHPETGECDVKRAYPKWRRNVNHLWEVLMYARRIFHKVESKDAFNTEAATLYERDLEKFKLRVSETVQQSKDRLYDAPATDDPHAIRFSALDPEIHEEARKKMLSPKTRSPSGEAVKNAQTSGLSWMQAGSAQIFSKPELGPNSKS